MDTVWLLYWFTRLDAIHNVGMALVAVGISLAILAFLVFSLANSLVTSDREKELAAGAKKVVKLSLFAMLFPGVVTMVFIPTERDMAIIVGGKVVAQLATAVAPEAKKTLEKLNTLIQGRLDYEITNIGKEKPEEQ